MHDERDILEEALKVYGGEKQTIVCMEECGEVIQALSKALRGFEHNIAEELADLEIMIEQMKLFYRCHQEVNKWKSKKMVRLARRLHEQQLKNKKQGA